MLTIAELLALAAGAGFSGNDLAVAVAIALVESGGNPAAYNPEPGAKGGTPAGQGSYGLWQIYLKVHPEFSTQQLLDPAGNAAAAYQVYVQSGFSFRQWTGSFVNGKYRSQLPAVEDQLSASSPADAAAPDQTGADVLDVSGDGTTNYWPMLLIGAELLFAWLWARG